MHRFYRILVLCSADDDAAVLSFTSRLVELAHSEFIGFCHLVDKTEIPPALLQKYPWLAEPLDQQVESRLRASVAQHFWASPTQTQIILREGPTLPGILKLTGDLSIDLLVAARNAFNQSFLTKLARKAPCSLCILPPDSRAAFSSILVPVDFSEYCLEALDLGISLASAQGLREIAVCHVDIPSYGARRATIAEERIREMNLLYKQERMDEFLKTVSWRGISPKVQVLTSYSVASGIQKYAQELQTDLLIFATRGKDALAAILLGSNAEDILRSVTIPAMAVKKKGTGMDLLQSLLRS